MLLCKMPSVRDVDQHEDIFSALGSYDFKSMPKFGATDSSSKLHLQYKPEPSSIPQKCSLAETDLNRLSERTYEILKDEIQRIEIEMREINERLNGISLHGERKVNKVEDLDCKLQPENEPLTSGFEPTNLKSDVKRTLVDNSNSLDDSDGHSPKNGKDIRVSRSSPRRALLCQSCSNSISAPNVDLFGARTDQARGCSASERLSGSIGTLDIGTVRSNFERTPRGASSTCMFSPKNTNGNLREKLGLGKDHFNLCEKFNSASHSQQSSLRLREQHRPGKTKTTTQARRGTSKFSPNRFKARERNHSSVDAPKVEGCNQNSQTHRTIQKHNFGRDSRRQESKSADSSSGLDRVVCSKVANSAPIAGNKTSARAATINDTSLSTSMAIADDQKELIRCDVGANKMADLAQGSNKSDGEEIAVKEDVSNTLETILEKIVDKLMQMMEMKEGASSDLTRSERSPRAHKLFGEISTKSQQREMLAGNNESFIVDITTALSCLNDLLSKSLGFDEEFKPDADLSNPRSSQQKRLKGCQKATELRQENPGETPTQKRDESQMEVLCQEDQVVNSEVARFYSRPTTGSYDNACSRSSNDTRYTGHNLGSILREFSLVLNEIANVRDILEGKIT